jgi:hypothetical protein
MGRDNGDPLGSLKPQPGQFNQYKPTFHPLPGDWAKEQLNGLGERSQRTSSRKDSSISEIDRARAAEEAVHHYWEEWQGVIPGKPVYENPRDSQNTLLPSARFGTEGRGYG